MERKNISVPNFVVKQARQMLFFFFLYEENVFSKYITFAING